MLIGFVVRRLLAGLVVLWVVSGAVFVLVHVVAPHPERVVGGARATEETLAVIRRDLGLERPLIVQYGRFVGGLGRGDLGRSYLSGEAVGPVIMARLPVTGLLVGGGCVLALAGGAVLGVAGMRWRGLVDGLVLGVAAVPAFLVGLLLLYAVFGKLGDLGIRVVEPGPPLAEHFWRRMVLPWVTLALLLVASYARLIRASLDEAMGSDYVRTARAAGVPERRVVWRHGLRTAAVPVVTQLGVDLGTLLAGAVVVEKVFGLQGAGQLTAQAITAGDAPVVLGAVLVAAGFAVLAATLADLAYPVLDPRIRRASPP